MEIERVVEYKKQVGFECDMCLQKFSTDFSFKDFPFSRKSTYHFDDHSKEVVDFLYAHFCEKCHDTLMQEMRDCYGVRFNRI